MNQPIETIDNLSMVSLAIEAGTVAGARDLTPEPVIHEFVFGIAPEGLSPFEFQLAGLAEGEEIAMTVRPQEIGAFFGPGRSPVAPQIFGPEGFHLNVRVLGVTRAESREIVKAMAEMAACSDCGGDCCGHDH
jgi:hypothetical protein